MEFLRRDQMQEQVIEKDAKYLWFERTRSSVGPCVVNVEGRDDPEKVGDRLCNQTLEAGATSRQPYETPE